MKTKPKDPAAVAVFCRRIAEQREQAGHTQYTAAKAIGISRDAWRQYERDMVPGGIRLIQMRDVLGMDLDAILAPLPKEAAEPTAS